MAALLKSGKFLRMVTGLARPGQNQPVPTQQHSLLPLNNSNGTGNTGPTLGEKGGGIDHGGNSLVNLADGSAAFQAWSLSHLHNALPVLAGVSETEEERRKEKKDPLLSYLADKEKVEEFCNKKWVEKQKELVELEREIELKRKAIENKKDDTQSKKESTLKSNALLTKGKRKKAASKRKSSTQNNNKELGRVISLNVIYEEPSQIQPSPVKAITDDNEPTTRGKDNNDTTAKPAQQAQENGSNTEVVKKENVVEDFPNETSGIGEEKHILDETNSFNFVEPEKEHSSLSPPESRNHADAEPADKDNNFNINTSETSHAKEYISEDPASLLPPPDDNWESRLPLVEFSELTNTAGQEVLSVASDVHYSETPTVDNISTQAESHFLQKKPQDVSGLVPSGYVPMVQVFEIEPYTEAHWYPLEVVCRTFREQGRYWDLECLLDGSRSIRPEDRQTIYFWTLQAYADAGMFDRAVGLSGQLHLEDLGINFPAYHQLMSSFAAAQQTFAPTLPYSSYASSESCYPNNAYMPPADGGQTDISSQTYMSTTPSDISVASTPRSSCPPTPCPPSSEDIGTSVAQNVTRGSQRYYREERNSRRSSRSSKLSTERKVSAAAANSVSQQLQRKFKKALNEKNLEECLATYYQLEKFNSKSLSKDLITNKSSMNVTDSSSLIELLVKDDRIKEATQVAESILASEAYPIPKIFRFLLNRLASNGDVQAMSTVGKYLTPRVKKEVSFDNRLCNAYLAAGRGEEYLDILQKDVDELTKNSRLQDIDPMKIQTVKDRFPRGGAMGLLESDPYLVESFTTLAHKFANLGYIAPMNVLWTYHFIGGRHDIATPLWQDYVQTCPQIMFQKVCQTARSTCNADLAQRLVNLLETASTVTMGARGIAYSCLIDVLTQQQNYIAGVDALNNGLLIGLKLEDVNRTALKRLKQGLEETTNNTFPFEIPKKDGSFGSTAHPNNDCEERDETEMNNSIAMLN